MPQEWGGQVWHVDLGKVGTIIGALWLGLLALPVVGAQPNTDASILTSSSASITFHGPVQADGLILSHRQLDAPTTTSLAFSATVHGAVLTRYDWNKSYVSATAAGAASMPGQDVRPTLSVTRLDHAFVRLSETPRASAVLVQVDRATLHASGSALQVRSRVNNPVIHGEGSTSTNGIHFVPTEMGTQTAPGAHIDVAMGGFQGNSTGRLALYWFNASALLFTDQGEVRLDSSVWREAVDPAGTYWIQHRTWFELTAESAQTDLALDTLDGGANDVVFAKRVDVDGVNEIAIDSVDQGTGRPESQAAPNRSAMYLHGTLRAGVAPDRGSGQAYKVAYRGRVDGYSVGGGPLVTATTGVTAFSLVAAALLALIAIKSLLADTIGRLAAPLYTKLRKDDLLNLEARDSVYRLIQQFPGIHFLALHQQVRNGEGAPKIAYGALAYHLGQMERFELIVSKREGRFRRYFDVAARIGADTARIALLQTQPIPVIARLILDNPGATQTVLQQRVLERVALSRQTLSYHLGRLLEKDLVVRETAGRFARYRPTERLLKLAAYLEAPGTTDKTVPAAHGALTAA